MSIQLPERGAPPTKKARTEADAGYRSDMDTSPSLFLDTFSKEVLDNILRFFSRVPQARDWVRSIPLQSIVELYGVTGELGKFMKPRFNTLYISKSFHAEYRSRGINWKKREGPILWTDDMDVARRFVLAGGGQALQTIIVHPYLYHVEAETEIAEDFHNNCPNVKFLTIIDDHGAWVSRFGDRLEGLEIQTGETSDIAKNCGNLRELSVCSPVGTYIGEDELWKSIGSTLECLKIPAHGLREKEIQSIKTHCRNLRRTYIYGWWNFTNSTSDLLASYGNQLEYCHVGSMDESQLRRIVSSCQNVRFSAEVYGIRGLNATLKVVKDQLDKIVVKDLGIADFEDLTNAWGECINLRDLRVWNCTIEHAKAIMANAKKSIKNLSILISNQPGGKDVKEMLNVFSKGTGSVEEVVFSKFGVLKLPKDAFDNFISGNRTSLRKFSVGGYTISNIPTGILDNFFTLFLNCPALEYVSGLPFSRNQVKSLQRRGVSCCDLRGKPL